MRLTIPPKLAGERLDKALAALLPEASLRHRRRLVETGAAVLDGHAARPGVRVRQGQVLELAGQDEPLCPPGVRILERMGGYAAVVKPAGVHAAGVAGAAGPSVESCLPELFPGERPILLNRLDLLTSGFVLAALGRESADRFRAQEQAGQVRKEYLALVHGRLEGQLAVRNRLDVADRARVRVLDEPDPDPARHTSLTALEHDPERNLTLVRAVIARGARHQIRAHLAHLGHAIAGDGLYGRPEHAEQGGVLYLHHRLLSFEGFRAGLEPGWDLNSPDIS